jgi:hypothetical protein
MKYYLSLFIVIFLFSCSKDEDKDAPKIEFLRPMGQDTFSVGLDSLFLNFKLTDNSNLSQYSYVIKDSLENKYATGGRFIEGKEFEHKSYVIFGGFSDVQKLWLYVTVYDRTYNATVANRVFYVQP